MSLGNMQYSPCFIWKQMWQNQLWCVIHSHFSQKNILEKSIKFGKIWYTRICYLCIVKKHIKAQTPMCFQKCLFMIFFFTLQHPHIWFIPAMKKYYFSPDCRIQDGAVLVIHYGEQQAVLPAGEVFVICQRWRLVVHVQCIYIYEISWLFVWRILKIV